MAEREKWALISVFNKEGIVEFAKRLVKLGWKILSSGGTAKVLREGGIEVRDVAELVGGGAILGHRVVTLSRELHAGLLADPNNTEHTAEMQRLGLPNIGMVVCDFYPLREAIANDGATVDSVVELTDIGGPTMVRSAAKGGRIVICRFEDREPVLQELESSGSVRPETRQSLRARAEFEVARYVGDSAVFHGAGLFNAITGERVLCMPKGENGPQSPAALYSTGSDDPLAIGNFRLVAGSPASYNNLTDTDRCLQTLTHIAAIMLKMKGAIPDVVVCVKHGNPCGASAMFADPAQAVIKAVRGDTRAVFGGTVMCNFSITRELAELMVSAGMPEGQTQKFDCVIASGFDADAIEVLTRKGGKCRMVENRALAEASSLLDMHPRFRYVRGGILVQPNYKSVLDFKDPDLKTYGPLPEMEMPSWIQMNLALAWAICATSNSNTITIVSDGMLIGNGVGQQDRVGAAELAVKRAMDAGHGDMLNAVACSDSFFPQPDAPKVLIDAGIRAIFSTSGSIKDGEVQELCQSCDVVLVQLPDSKARGFFGH